VAAASGKGLGSVAIGAVHRHDVEGTLNGDTSESGIVPAVQGQRANQLTTTAPDGTVTSADQFIEDGAAGLWRFDMQGVDAASRWPVLWLVDLPADWHD